MLLTAVCTALATILGGRRRKGCDREGQYSLTPVAKGSPWQLSEAYLRSPVNTTLKNQCVEWIYTQIGKGKTEKQFERKNWKTVSFKFPSSPTTQWYNHSMDLVLTSPEKAERRMRRLEHFHFTFEHFAKFSRKPLQFDRENSKCVSCTGRSSATVVSFRLQESHRVDGKYIIIVWCCS